ncbi:hypothetical protein GCM10009838_18890 [Catenulispora subtropica]|uniref:Uncharacterized protein n=1 Tax=Catenulispora subtropica TaxID=450798 RepID=A0ABP5CDG8_9ACTN
MVGCAHTFEDVGFTGDADDCGVVVWPGAEAVGACVDGDPIGADVGFGAVAPAFCAADGVPVLAPAGVVASVATVSDAAGPDVAPEAVPPVPPVPSVPPRASAVVIELFVASPRAAAPPPPHPATASTTAAVTATPATPGARRDPAVHVLIPAPFQQLSGPPRSAGRASVPPGG